MANWTTLHLLASFETMPPYTDVEGRLVCRAWDDYRCLVCHATVPEHSGGNGGRLTHAEWHLAVESDDGPMARHLRIPLSDPDDSDRNVDDDGDFDDADEGGSGGRVSA